MAEQGDNIIRNSSIPSHRIPQTNRVSAENIQSLSETKETEKSGIISMLM